MIGRTVSHYRVTRKLGSGGMGVVYEAEDVRHGALVAIKFLPPELGRDDSAKKRFIEEARSAFALDHPNICRVHELDETAAGQLYLVMTRYEGETLRDRLAHGRLPIEEIRSLTRQLLRGLAAAHDKGIVHRDVKAANIFVTTDGEAKILDFGLARFKERPRFTRTGAVIGSPDTMSPEQCRGEAADERSDLWALGVVIYQMLTGQLPFGGESVQAVLYAILSTEPTPVAELRPETPERLAALVAACLTKDPALRPASCLDALALLGESTEFLSRGRAVQLPWRRRPRWFVAGIVLMAVAVVAVAVAVLQTSDTAITSLAVLPLNDHSPGPRQEFLANGLTDQLIASLGTVDLFERVISYNSVRRYRDDPKTLPEVARALAVDAIVEGAITRVGDRLQLTARLVDTRSGRQLWAQTFERDFGDILQLESDIVRAVVQQIRGAVSPAELAAAVKTKDVDPNAYLVYLQGRDRFSQSYHTTAGIRECIELFSRAVELDPAFAAAWAGLGESYNTMSCHAHCPPREGYPRAQEAIRRALALDPDCAEAHVALAHLLFEHAWDFPAALREVDRAIALNPSLAWAHHLRAAGILRCLGRHEEALAGMRRAVALDPLSANLNADLAMTLCTAGRCADALAQIERTAAMFPDWNPLYETLGYWICKGDDAQALALLEERESELEQLDHGAWLRSYLVCLKAKAGKLAEARAILAEVESAFRAGDVTAYFPAVAACGVGDLEHALGYLETALEARDPRLTRLGVDRVWDPVRGDRRFRKILASVGLASP